MLRSTLLALVFLGSLSAFALAEDPPAPQPAPKPPDPAPKPAPAPRAYPPPERATPGLNREQMWPAPTAEDWAKPCLLTWQRTWDDAVAVAEETGKPILVCINMDGEIASEHYAGVRYRQPEIAALYEPYVTVIASVYRHTPRDHDDDGQRIPCPRFGGVTCGEHIAIEPGIFEKFCDGQRVAPRHIMVELGTTGPAGARAFQEVYDVYYRNDTASVFQSIEDGISDRIAEAKPPIVRGDRPIVERVKSRHVEDRNAVEKAYAEGSAEQRKALLEAARTNPQAAPLDLLRLAVFGLDPDLSRSARQALTQVDAPEATTLVSDALRVPMEAPERAALIATLERLGERSVLARWLAVVHKGLAGQPGTVDPSAWKGPGSERPVYMPAVGEEGLPAHLEDKARAAREAPQDPALRLDLAEASLAYGLEASATYPWDERRARLVRRALLEDARRAGREAERLGATGWRVNATLALAAYYAGDLEDGYARAETAMKALPPGDGSWTSMAVITVFAESRWKAIKKAVKEKLDFPPAWLTDVHAAYAVLLKHPMGTAEQVLWHYDLLDWLGALDQAERVLSAGIERFRDSPLLHARLRAALLKRHGVQGLTNAYRDLVKPADAPAVLVAYAALAQVEAGEQLRRSASLEAALLAYGQALALYDRALSAEPALKESGDVAVALALAGRARVHLMLGRDEPALSDLLASFERSPGSAGTRDGMGITPGETGQALLARLVSVKQDALADRLKAALDALDPELLKPDRP